jgi:uncharacterized protein YndB with AHSA1/START domain
MPQQRIVIEQEFNRPVAELFAQLADHNQLAKVFGIPVRRIKDGADEPNGVGSVRRIGPALLPVEETVTAIRPNAAIEYRITRGGGPMRNHRGCQEFTPTPRGTRLRWTVAFDAPPVVGDILRMVLDKAISRGLRGIGGR